ncbi:MAG TPA: N-acetyl sugar amidotransferase [Rhodobacteraceae bacterium]|nr:N-acetyl sugar amidotransferase [Paracoccaceae bacterium]
MKTQNTSDLHYQVCTRTVMDTTDPDIRFDENGVSNYVPDFAAFIEGLPSPDERKTDLERRIAQIKAEGMGKRYDCVLGLSGGVDSSYLAYLSKEWGLRPLVVHFDNGWNSELAVDNIERIVSHLGFELATHVMNWEEFRDLQRSYFLASVVDIEVPTDNLIFGALFRLAAKHKVRTILSGTNYATEWLMPPRWNYRKNDAVNIKAIQAKFGSRKLKELPILGVWNQGRYTLANGIRTFAPLDLIYYSKAGAKKLLMEELGWRDYGGKHYESVFTRFYQGYVLPKKFNIDKRRAHLSTLILNGEITRDEALAELQQPTYDEDLQAEDRAYLGKKLGFSEEEFDRILAADPVPHEVYGTDAVQRARYFKMVGTLSQLRRTLLGRKAA